MENKISEIKGYIQSIKSSPFHLSLRIRDKETYYLYIPRGSFDCILYKSKNELSAEWRINDQFREKIKHSLKNAKIIEFKLEKEIIYIKVFQNKQLKIIFFGYIKSGCFFGVIENKKQYLPYRTKPNYNFAIDDLDNFLSSELIFIKNKISLKELDKIKQINEYTQISDIETRLTKNKKHLNKKISKKIENISNDIKKLKFATIAKEALSSNTIMINEVEEFFIFENIKIQFKKNQTLFKRRDFIFKKLKAYENAVSLQNKRLIAEMEKVNSLKINFEDCIVYPIFKIFDSLEVNTKNVDGLKFTGPNGEILFIGRNIQENINLKKNWANKNDYWFHLENEASAHGFLRLADGVLLESSLEFVAKTFAIKENKKSIKLIYNKVKNIKSLKGSPGTIILKNHLTYQYHIKN